MPMHTPQPCFRQNHEKRPLSSAPLPMKALITLVLGLLMTNCFGQTDSVVQMAADSQGLVLVPFDQLPKVGTFWTVGSSGLFPVPYPCAPSDPNAIFYALGPNGVFLVDTTGGAVPQPTGSQALRGISSAALVEAQMNTLLGLIDQVQEAQANQQFNPATPNDPSPSFSYPTNIALKWYLTGFGREFGKSLSLGADGTLYVPDFDNQTVWGIDTASVSTNDPNYPALNDFVRWTTPTGVQSAYGDIITPVLGLDGTVCAVNVDGSSAANYGGRVIYTAVTSSDTNVGWSANLPFLPYYSYVDNEFQFQMGGFYLETDPAAGNDGSFYTCLGPCVFALAPRPNYTNTVDVYTNTIDVPFTNNCYLTNVTLKWWFVYPLANTKLEVPAYGEAPFDYSRIAIGLDGTVYAFSMWGQVLALDATNGTLKWVSPFPLMNVPDNYQASPAIGSDGTIYCGFENEFFAIDPKAPTTNGVMGYKWLYTSTNSSEFFYWAPVIGPGGTVYVESSVCELYAFDSQTGVPKWADAVDSYTDFDRWGSLAVAADGEIYLAGSDGTFYSFRPDNGYTNYSYQTGTVGLTAPVIAPDGTIYTESAGVVFAFAGSSPIACSTWPEYGKNARRSSAASAASLTSPMMTNNGFQFAITGTSNAPVCPCASSDLMNWTNIGQIVLTNGTARFVDTQASNFPYRFYLAFPQ